MRGEAFENGSKRFREFMNAMGSATSSPARNAMKKAKFDQDEYHLGMLDSPQQFVERVARKGIQRLQWEFDRSTLRVVGLQW